MLFRSIIKLQVNIAKGETIVNYDDQTTRRIRHRNCGFTFKYQQSSHPMPGTIVAGKEQPHESQTAQQTNSLCKIGSGNDLEKPSSALANIVEPKNDATANAGLEKNTVVLIDNNAKFSLRCSSDTDSIGSESANKLEVKALGAEHALEDNFTLSELDASVAQLSLIELRDPGGEAPFRQAVTGSGPSSSVALIMAIMPELITTEIDENENEENDAHFSERTNYFFTSKHLVSWHLNTCSLKHCKGVPICNCLKIKENISELQETLNNFLDLSSPARLEVDRRRIINKFVQSFDNTKFLLQALCELLVHHIFFNAECKDVHCRNALVQNQPMTN